MVGKLITKNQREKGVFRICLLLFSIFFLLALIPGFAAAQKPIWIGPSLPLTGGFAETGKASEKG